MEEQNARSSARHQFWALLWKRAIVVVLGILVGAVLAVFTAPLLIDAEAHSVSTKVNGWSAALQCGEESLGILLRAACAKFIAAGNLPQEAVYWGATVDSTGQPLNGGHDYRQRFPPGGLPPNEAFWSLTMVNPQGFLVDNPINRYNVGDRSGLVQGADGSIDIYIQHTAPAGHEANWLPAPTGDFTLVLRVYQPGAAILSGAYRVPPVVEAR